MRLFSQQPLFSADLVLITQIVTYLNIFCITPDNLIINNVMLMV